MQFIQKLLPNNTVLGVASGTFNSDNPSTSSVNLAGVAGTLNVILVFGPNLSIVDNDTPTYVLQHSDKENTGFTNVFSPVSITVEDAENMKILFITEPVKRYVRFSFTGVVGVDPDPTTVIDVLSIVYVGQSRYGTNSNINQA